MDTPKSIIFEDLIKGFYDGMYIKPNFYDISFYFVEVKTKDQKLDQPIESFGLTDKSYIIFLDEKKYIENSNGIKLIPYEVNHQPNHFQQTPIYLDKKPNTSFLNYSKLCKNKVKPYDYSDNTINYLPIIIVNKNEYKGKTADDFYNDYLNKKFSEKFYKDFNIFMKKYGFRGEWEFDIKNPRFNDNPKSILSQIYSSLITTDVDRKSVV